MSARNHMTNDELVRDAVYWRKREKVYRNIDQPRWGEYLSSTSASIGERAGATH